MTLAMGRWAESEGHLRQALAIYDLQPGHQFKNLVLYQLAQALARQRKIDEALDVLGRAIESGYRTSRGPLEADEHLETRRNHPRFAALVRRLPG